MGPPPLLCALPTGAVASTRSPALAFAAVLHIGRSLSQPHHSPRRTCGGGWLCGMVLLKAWRCGRHGLRRLTDFENGRCVCESSIFREWNSIHTIDGTDHRGPIGMPIDWRCDFRYTDSPSMTFTHSSDGDTSFCVHRAVSCVSSIWMYPILNVQACRFTSIFLQSKSARKPGGGRRLRAGASAEAYFSAAPHRARASSATARSKRVAYACKSA